MLIFNVIENFYYSKSGRKDEMFNEWSWDYSSVVEHVSSMFKALGSNSALKNKYKLLSNNRNRNFYRDKEMT